MLVPHGIGNGIANPSQPTAGVLERRPRHLFAQGILRLHVVGEGVHAGHGEGRAISFLTVALQWRYVGWQVPGAVLALAACLHQGKVALDEQATKTAGGVIGTRAWRWLYEAGNKDSDVSGRI